MKLNPSTHTVYEKIVLVIKRILQVVAALLGVGVLLIIFYCWFGNPVTFVTAGRQMNQHTLIQQVYPYYRRNAMIEKRRA